MKGTYQPQSATLDALFNALETPEAERQCARALVQAPRTIQALQQEERLLIHKGDLFKELRLRQRLSQQALAQELNESVGYLPPSTLCLNSG